MCFTRASGKYLPFIVLTVGGLLGGQNQPKCPRGRAQFSFPDGKKVVVDYGRPVMDGRIFGRRVPFGKIWHPGRDQATSFATEASLEIDNVTVPPGTYTLYTLPSASDWILIISQKTGQRSSPYPAGYDFARLRMKKRTLLKPITRLTITLDHRGSEGGAMNLMWEKTEVWVEFKEKHNFKIIDPDEGDSD